MQTPHTTPASGTIAHHRQVLRRLRTSRDSRVQKAAEHTSEITATHGWPTHSQTAPALSNLNDAASPRKSTAGTKNRERTTDMRTSLTPSMPSVIVTGHDRQASTEERAAAVPHRASPATAYASPAHLHRLPEDRLQCFWGRATRVAEIYLMVQSVESETVLRHVLVVQACKRRRLVVI